jgi:hypothetical protein
MKTLAALFCLLAAAAPRAWTETLPGAIVWIPAETFTGWSQVSQVLASRSDLKLTIALTPAMTTAHAKAALAGLVAARRVEIAARIHGDPILPLVASHPSAPRPDDALERAAQSRQSVERRMGSGPAGFVPGEGALDASLIGPLGAAGSPWILTGPYAVAGIPWVAENRVVFVPARASKELSGPGALVVDESAGGESLFLSELLRSTRQGWVTVAELVKAAGDMHGEASGIPSWPGWGGAPAGIPSDASARSSWDAYGETVKALARYENSGAADLKVLEGATALLRKAQEARFFRAPEPGAAAGLPAELRSRLLAVFKKIKATAPDSLYQSAPSNSPATSVDLPTGVHATSGANWLLFENPAGSSAKAPFGVPNAQPWLLRSLRVEWDDEKVVFLLSPSHVDSPSPAPRPVYDIYIDLNHRVGSGAIRLFDGRGAFAQARDAWEFALSVAGADAHLWRAAAGGDNEQIAALKADVDAVKGEVRVAVPREHLRGNPERWGYIALSLAEDPARPNRAPAAALVGPDGAQTLGVLAPLEVQKAVLEHPGAPQRVAAVRIELPSQP